MGPHAWVRGKWVGRPSQGLGKGSLKASEVGGWSVTVRRLEGLAPSIIYGFFPNSGSGGCLELGTGSGCLPRFFTRWRFDLGRSLDPSRSSARRGPRGQPHRLPGMAWNGARAGRGPEPWAAWRGASGSSPHHAPLLDFATGSGAGVPGPQSRAGTPWELGGNFLNSAWSQAVADTTTRLRDSKGPSGRRSGPRPSHAPRRPPSGRAPGAAQLPAPAAGGSCPLCLCVLCVPSRASATPRPAQAPAQARAELPAPPVTKEAPSALQMKSI